MRIPSIDPTATEEVMRYIEHGRLMELSVPLPTCAPILAVDHLEDLDSAVFGDPKRFPFGWNDVRNYHLRHLYGSPKPPLCDDVHRAAEQMFAQIWLPFRSRHHRYVSEELIELSFGSLNNLLLIRSICGRTKPFWEDLFAVLRAGGVPFGWIGTLEAGRFLTYFSNPTLMASLPRFADRRFEGLGGSD